MLRSAQTSKVRQVSQRKQITIIINANILGSMKELEARLSLVFSIRISVSYLTGCGSIAYKYKSSVWHNDKYKTAEGKKDE